MQPATPHDEHRWLKRLEGEWIVSTPTPESKVESWRERVRMLGELWALAEGEGTMPDGTITRTLMTLGYDPARGRYVGTWAGSMMTHLWIYDGAVDGTGNALVLDCTGPDFEHPGRTLAYQDILTFLDDGHRTLTSRVRTDDGGWKEIMSADYRRA